MSMGEHGRPVPLSGSQMREFTARLERDFAVPRVLDPVSLQHEEAEVEKGLGSVRKMWQFGALLG